jgi:hypothetical protein
MPFPHSQARSGLNVLLQSIDLQVAAEELVPTAPTFESPHGPAAGSPFPFGSSCHSTSRGVRLNPWAKVLAQSLDDLAFGPGFERERPRQVGGSMSAAGSGRPWTLAVSAEMARGL